MEFRIQLQIQEALGSVNRWYCSIAYRREITNKELLLRYYITSGGVADFARRYDQAMGDVNRWYCSQFYGREIREPQILWDYYVKHTSAAAA